jgi:N-acetylglutamate synthase-like GNAT family acetyltransferase
VSDLLHTARLVPIDDTAQFGDHYAVAATPEGAIVGEAGYERYAADILLRSVAVAEARRSEGIGRRLALDRLADARRRGCTAAFLLTDTAAEYWKRHGFVQIDRSASPAGIARSREWGSACPVSATAMRMSLSKEISAK